MLHLRLIYRHVVHQQWLVVEDDGEGLYGRANDKVVERVPVRAVKQPAHIGHGRRVDLYGDLELDQGRREIADEVEDRPFQPSDRDRDGDPDAKIAFGEGLHSVQLEQKTLVVIYSMSETYYG